MNTTKTNSPTLAFTATPNDDDIQAEVYDSRTGVVVCAVYKASEVSPQTIVDAVNNAAAQSSRIAELEAGIQSVLDSYGQRGSHPRRALAALLAKEGA